MTILPLVHCSLLFACSNNENQLATSKNKTDSTANDKGYDHHFVLRGMG